MWKKRSFSLFLAVVMLLTYCFSAVVLNVAAADVTTIQSGETKTVTISEGGEIVYISFTPTESAGYVFYSSSVDDTKGYIYDANMNELLQDDDGGEEFNFRLQYDMKAGTTYIFGVSFHETTSIGDICVKLEKTIVAKSLTIDQGDNIKAYVKDSVQLTASLSPQDCIYESVTWSSDNNALATVDNNGKVSLLAPGTANITVVSEKGLKDTCKIEIADYSTIKANNLTEALTTKYQKNAYFYFTPESSGRYVFSSFSDKDTFAAIYSSARDLLASDDNSGADNNFRLECDMTGGTTYILQCRFNKDVLGSFNVKIAKTVAANSIVIDQGSKIIGYIGNKQQFTVSFSPENYAAESLSWSSSDSSVVSVSASGAVEFLKKGTAVITVTSQKGLTAKCTVEVAGYPVINIGEEKIVKATVESGAAIFEFKPTVTGLYAFYSYNADIDTYGYIYDGNMNELACNDDMDENTDCFYVNYKMTAGETYYLKSTPYFSETTGTYSVQIKKIQTATSVSIIPDNSISGYADEYRYLSVSFLPENSVKEEVVWSSSNESVAVVSDYGRVHLISEGQAVITVKSENGLTATCLVTVNKRPAATSVTIGNGDAISGDINTYLMLWYFFSPEECQTESVTWSSSDENIVTVNENGIISFVSKGTAIITITSENGLTDTCEVTVIEEIPATAVEILCEEVLFGYVGEKIALYANFLPGDCIVEEVTWKSSDESVATVDEMGYVSLLKSGTVTITVTSEKGLTSSCEITIKEISSIICDEEVSFDTAVDRGVGFFSFVPDADGYYAIYSYNNSIDTCGSIYDSDMNLLVSDDNSDTDNNFYARCYMTAGETYYFKTRPVSFEDTGTYSIKLVRLVDATSISIVQGDTYTVNFGSEETFEVIFEPFNSIIEKVTWSSSDTSILTIDENGLAVPVARGKVIITAVTYSGLTATCEVTVDGVPTDELPDMPDGHVDIGTDFIAHIVTPDAANGLGLSGLKVTSKEANSEDNEQLYYFERQVDGSYKITNVKTRYILGVSGSPASGAGIVLLSEGESEQTWFVYLADGNYILRAAGTDDCVLAKTKSSVKLEVFAEDILSITFIIKKTNTADYERPSSLAESSLTNEQINKISEILCSVSEEYSAMASDELAQLIKEYSKEAYDMGVKGIIANALCINMRFMGGIEEVERVLAKTNGFTHESIYSALLTDTGSQVGAYRNRNQSFYYTCLSSL